MERHEKKPLDRVHNTQGVEARSLERRPTARVRGGAMRMSMDTMFTLELLLG